MCTSTAFAQKPGFLPKIVGGKPGLIEDVPWQVAIVDREASDIFQGQFCAGTIIDPFWILTASHCVQGLVGGEIQIVAGITNLDDPNGPTVQVRDVVQVINHPDFSAGMGLSHDIALLRLADPLDLSGPSAQMVPFATAQDAAAGLIDAGVEALISGWGTLSETGNNFPDSLHIAAISIVSTDSVNLPNSYNGIITEVMLAAGNFEEGGVDTCRGDSGGPLVVPNATGDGWIVAGITSWGDGCGRPFKPGIYTRVSEFEDWIRENTGIGLNLPKPEFGIAILSVISDTLVNQFARCDGEQPSLAAVFLLNNEGQNPLSNVQVTATLAVQGGPPQTLNETLPFDPALAPGATRVLNFSIPLLAAGNYTFTINFALTGGLEDGNPSNNSYSRSFSVVEGQPIVVRGRTDRYPDENFWAVTNESGSEILVAPQAFPLSNNQTFNRDACLPEGCYQLVLADSFGDGVDQDSVLSVRIDNVVVTAILGNRDFDLELAPFCVLNPPVITELRRELASGTAFLAWEDFSELEEGFIIQAAGSDNRFREVARTGANTTSVTLEGLPDNQMQRIRIRAFRNRGSSVWSVEQSVITDLPSEAVPVFSVYPNPAKGMVHVGWDAALPRGQVFLELLDLSGRQVAMSPQFLPSQQPYQWHLPAVGQGLYLLRVNSPEGSLTRKLVVE